MRIVYLVGFFALACSATGLPTSTGGTGGTTGGSTTGGSTTGGGTGGTTGNPPPASCGGKGGAQCADDEFCDFPDSAQCGNFDVSGTCAERPQACPDFYSPVCGCDYITYGNSCEANGAGVDVAFDGPCEQPPTSICGGESGGKCGDHAFCYFTPGSYCDWADGTGTCMPRPDVCPDNLDPVCGCDSQDYSNECDANAAGVGVAYYGKCGSPADNDCRNTGCPTGQTCQLCWTSYACLDPNVAC